MKGLIGKKLGMTQVYDDKGRVIPVTIMQAGPCVVVDVKTKEKNGYSAIQLGFGEMKAKNASKAYIGHLKNAGRQANPPSVIREMRVDSDPEVQTGSEIKADIFANGEFIDVTGTSKGRGFQGVVKRWHFAGGRYSHGGGWKRKPGSSGQRETPGNIIKNKRYPGHMGNVRSTTQNLIVVKSVPEENLIYVKGAVPGPNGGTILIRSAKKKS